MNYELRIMKHPFSKLHIPFNFSVCSVPSLGFSVLKKQLRTPIIILTILLFVFLLSSCGNRRSPTGGPVDDIRPEIAYTIPLEYEQIENNEIVIAFTKIMDRTSVTNGIVVSPSQLNKKIVWKKGQLHIQFTDDLPDDTNIIIFLNQSIRCDRNNTFEEHKLLTFRNGVLQRNSVSGFITIEDDTEWSSEFGVRSSEYLTPYQSQTENWTEASSATTLIPPPPTPTSQATWGGQIDNGSYSEFRTPNSELLTNIALLDQDSLLVFNRTITESNYTFDYLNSGSYTIRAFVDTNNNNRYDFGRDPFFRESFDLPTTDMINIHLVVADTVRPNLTSVNNLTNNHLILNFNKPLVQMPVLSIFESQSEIDTTSQSEIGTTSQSEIGTTNSTGTMVDILHQELVDRQLFVITAPLDTLRYMVQVEELLDRKGNERANVTNFFEHRDTIDTTSPYITETSPRNGTVVNNVRPEISITFSEIMFTSDVVISLREIETRQIVPLNTLNRAGFTLRFIPHIALREFSSYQLIIHSETKDNAENELEEDFVVQFIVINNQ